ncbi:hypothetical protein EVAR_92312_1 [Eumeta japonica]|uniref:Uncharacterized protein n=1 Tax=Eumeta variegata TaxID=151549 RepID=A0A4C1TJD6_EUMVA|nr:hypothetical protein EVAR_92312_1 [Eumeta japonica]
MKWTGHMLRCRYEKRNKQVTVWYPTDGFRSRGRKVRRWEDDLKFLPPTSFKLEMRLLAESELKAGQRAKLGKVRRPESKEGASPKSRTGWG